MTRLPDWRSRFQNFLSENANRVFNPGEWDCSLLTSGGVNAITGNDPAAPYRGNYSTVEEGQALLQADGYADQIAFVESLFSEIPILQASVGDIAVVEQLGEQGLGLVTGSSIAVVTLKRMGQVPLSKASRIFKV